MDSIGTGMMGTRAVRLQPPSRMADSPDTPTPPRRAVRLPAPAALTRGSTRFAGDAARTARRLPLSVVSGTLEFVLVGALAIVTAQLIWIWLTPPPLPGSIALGSVAAPGMAETRALKLDYDPFNRENPAEPAAGETALAEAAPETTLDLKLYGVRALKDPTAGSAIIRLPSHDQIAVTVGKPVLDGVTLAAVYADRVTLSHRGALESLSLGEALGDAAKTPAPKTAARTKTAATPTTATRRAPARTAPPAPRKTAANGAAPNAAASPAPAVETTAEAALRVSYESGAALLQALALKPRIDGASLNGMYIQGRGNAKLPAGIGLEEGDVLVAVNGMRLTSLQRLNKVKDRLDEAGPVTLILERAGEERTIDLIVDGGP